MAARIHYKVHPKENIYFAIKVIVSLAVYAALGGAIAFGVTQVNIGVLFAAIFYFLLFAAILLFQFGILIGYLRNNAVKITEKQFPDIHNIVLKQSQMLELEAVPDVYLLQQGGLLNAFATRFLGTDYIVIYSDILEEAYENNRETVEFVIAHELGHIRQKHLTKSLVLWPGTLMPFLGSAYSRACEYTCDNIGAAVAPKGAVTGLLVLAAGKKLYKKVNVQEFIIQNETESGFWSWIAEKISTHPRLTRRVAYQNGSAAVSELTSIGSRTGQREPVSANLPKAEPEKPASAVTPDHSRYMPGA